MKFNFPSLSSMLDESLATLVRFSLVILCGIIGSLCLIYFDSLEYYDEENFKFLLKIAMCCQLGFALFYSFYLIAERNKVPRWSMEILGIVLLLSFYFYLPEDIEDDPRALTRYFIFSVGFHMLAAFAPFVKKGEIIGFWEYNKTIFIAFLVSLLYTYVLLLGFFIALLAVDNLFNVNVKSNYYFYLFIFMQGIFNPWFFLSKVPRDFESLNQHLTYPKGLKIFTQFVLLPLVTVYLIILYLYEAKIIINWELPKGWVSNLVLCFSIAGILSLLLVYPVKDNEENKWISTFSKIFYLAIFPLIILLFIAIGVRIGQYGVTENRYFILMLALWLGAVSIYFLLRKQASIKVIPISLCLIAFLSSFGPWGAFYISDSSQRSRLEEIFERNRLLENGVIKRGSKNLSEEDRHSIYSILDYFSRRSELDEVISYFGPGADSLLKSDVNRYNKASMLMSAMEIDPVYSYSNINTYSFYLAEESGIPVQGFDFLVPINNYGGLPDKWVDSVKIKVELSGDKRQLEIQIDKEELLKLDVNPLMKKLSQNKQNHMNIYPDSLSAQSENSKLLAKVYFSNLQFMQDEDAEFEINSYTGNLLIKRK